MCCESQYPNENSVIRLKSNNFAPQNFGLAPPLISGRNTVCWLRLCWKTLSTLFTVTKLGQHTSSKQENFTVFTNNASVALAASCAEIKWKTRLCCSAPTVARCSVPGAYADLVTFVFSVVKWVQVLEVLANASFILEMLYKETCCAAQNLVFWVGNIYPKSSGYGVHSFVKVPWRSTVRPIVLLKTITVTRRGSPHFLSRQAFDCSQQEK